MPKQVTKWLSDNGKYFNTLEEAIWEDNRKRRIKVLTTNYDITDQSAGEILDYWPAIKKLMEDDCKTDG